MDPDNILSILASLGQNQGAQAAPQTNVLQSVAPQAMGAPQAPQPSPAAEIYHAATEASPPTPKPRRSLVDIIGHVADAFAQAGGATPMYQRTLDAEQKRITDAQDHSLKVDASTIANATGKFKLGDLQNQRLARAARGLQALQAQGGDINQAWPVLAQRMGFDPETTQTVGRQIAANPASLAEFANLDADAGDLKSKYSGNVVYAKDKAGNLHVFQASQGDDSARDVLPEGFTPVDPLQFVNTGGSQVGIGKQSGTPHIILPNTVSPDTAANNAQSNTNNLRTTGAQIEIAGMPARAQDGANGKGSDPNSGLKIISDIQQGFDNLHQLKALPGDAGSVIGDVTGALGRTALGQKIGATTGLSAAAQERELLAKNLANLQSDLIKSLPGNATRTKFEQEIQKKRLPDPTTMNYSIANRAIAQIRDAYTAALKSQPKAAVRAAPASNLPRLSPADAAKLKPGTPFIGLDGIQRVRH